jgi:transketolase
MLPEIERRGWNVRIVAAISPQLFRRQDAAYRDELCSEADRWDDRWRTGGTVEEVIDEAHLGPEHIMAAIERYVGDRQPRLRRLRALVESVAHGHLEVDG